MNMCSTSGTPLDQLDAALTGLGGLAPADRGSVGGGDRIKRLLTARAQLDAVLIAEVAAFDAASAYADDGAPTSASWLRSAARLARRDASTLVHQFRGAALGPPPDVVTALSAHHQTGGT